MSPDISAYVYLENSFVLLHITLLNGLPEAEIDAILDMVDFSTIWWFSNNKALRL